MKKLTWVLGLLLLLGSAGMASAYEGYVSGPQVSASVSFPGMRLVFGHPGIYCWYGGHYYSRMAWERFHRFHRFGGQPYTFYRLDRDNFRRYDRDRDGFDHRDNRNGDSDRFNRQNQFNDHDYDRN